MWLAVELADNTFGEYRDMLNENCPRVTPGKVHRDYLYDTILFLLDHEMDPNTVVDEHTTEAENIMAVLRFTDGPDVAARTMRLLLEHGGDPNLDVDSLTPLSWMDDELCIDPIWERWCCDHLVQCLMVMQAYGGGWHGTDGNSIDHFRCAKGTGPRSSRNLKSLIIGSEQKKVTSVRSISLRKQQEQSWQITFEHECPSAGFPAVRLFPQETSTDRSSFPLGPFP